MKNKFNWEDFEPPISDEEFEERVLKLLKLNWALMCNRCYECEGPKNKNRFLFCSVVCALKNFRK